MLRPGRRSLAAATLLSKILMYGILIQASPNHANSREACESQTHSHTYTPKLKPQGQPTGQAAA